MSAVLAIAGIALRTALRSRVVGALLIGLVAIVVLMPMTLRSDGTVDGLVQILLRYPLGLAFSLLCLSALWSGCAAVSREIETRTLHLVVTKPVRPLAIWLGKALGIFVLHAGVLAVCVAVAAGQLWIRVQEETGSEAAVADRLYAGHVASPNEASVIPDARRRLRAELAQGDLPDNITPEQRLRELVLTLQWERNAVPRTGVRQWRITLPASTRTNLNPVLVYRMSSSEPGSAPVPGEWIVRDTDGAPLAQLPQDGIPGAINRLELPGDLVRDSRDVVLEYINRSEEPVTVIFRPGDGVQVEVPAAGFPANLVRASLLMLGQLAVFSAVGLTAGSLLSFPVAAFLSLYLFLTARLQEYLAGMATGLAPAAGLRPEDAATWLDASLSLLYRSLALAARPLSGVDPLLYLARGHRVPGSVLTESLLLQTAVPVAVLALLTAVVLSRREVALPGQ